MNEPTSAAPGPAASPFPFCSRCGNNHLSVDGPRCFRCDRCGFRHFINPISAVVAILADVSGRLLLLRRAHDPGRGRLGLPGGFVDVHETAEEALRREIREEIGLEVPGLRYFLSLPNEYAYQGVVTPVLDLFYTGQLPSFAGARAVSEVQELVIREPSEIDLGELAFRSNAEALRRFIAGGPRRA